MSETTETVAPAETAATAASEQPSEATQGKWKAFLEALDGAAKEAGLVGLAIAGALPEAMGEDKTRLVTFGAAFLPNVADVGAVRDLSIMLVKSVATAAANEAGRVTAASVVAAASAADAAPAADAAGADTSPADSADA